MGPKMKCRECNWVGGDHSEDCLTGVEPGDDELETGDPPSDDSGDNYDDDDEDW